MTRGGGGLTAFIGNPGAGGNTHPNLNYGVLWLHTPTEFPAYDAMLADHELGHSFGNLLHSEEMVGYVRGQPRNLMDMFGGALPLTLHIEALLHLCGLD